MAKKAMTSPQKKLELARADPSGSQSRETTPLTLVYTWEKDATTGFFNRRVKSISAFRTSFRVKGLAKAFATAHLEDGMKRTLWEKYKILIIELDICSEIHESF